MYESYTIERNTVEQSTVHNKMINLQGKTPMQIGRIKKCLAKQYKYSWGVGSVEDNLKRKDNLVKFLEISPKIKYNRVKYNRMDNQQQAVYEKQLKQSKTVYCVQDKNENSWSSIPKIIYDVLTCPTTTTKDFM